MNIKKMNINNNDDGDDRNGDDGASPPSTAISLSVERSLHLPMGPGITPLHVSNASNEQESRKEDHVEVRGSEKRKKDIDSKFTIPSSTDNTGTKLPKTTGKEKEKISKGSGHRLELAATVHPPEESKSSTGSSQHMTPAITQEAAGTTARKQLQPETAATTRPKHREKLRVELAPATDALTPQDVLGQGEGGEPSTPSVESQGNGEQGSSSRPPRLRLAPSVVRPQNAHPQQQPQQNQHQGDAAATQPTRPGGGMATPRPSDSDSDDSPAVLPGAYRVPGPRGSVDDDADDTIVALESGVSTQPTEAVTDSDHLLSAELVDPDQLHRDVQHLVDERLAQQGISADISGNNDYNNNNSNDDKNNRCVVNFSKRSHQLVGIAVIVAVTLAIAMLFVTGVVATPKPASQESNPPAVTDPPAVPPSFSSSLPTTPSPSLRPEPTPFPVGTVQPTPFPTAPAGISPVLVAPSLSTTGPSQNASKTVQMDWFVPSESSFPPMTVNVGDTVVFNWNGVHNVYIHPTGNCTDTGRVLVGTVSGASYSFTQADVGEMEFVCNVGTHCENGMRVTFSVQSVGSEQQEQQWVQLGNNIDGEGARDQSGISVALSLNGTVLAIGAYRNNLGTGNVRVFVYDDEGGGSWVPLGNAITGVAEGDQFGVAVSLSHNGMILAVGANQFSKGPGTVQVFEWNGTSWTTMGSSMDGAAANDHFGWSVSLSGNGRALVVGAWANDAMVGGSDAGQVSFFEWSGVDWNPRGANLTGVAAGDWFGYAVATSADGSVVACGGPRNDDNGVNAGQVRVVRWDNNTAGWVPVGRTLTGRSGGQSDRFGESVALSGDGTILAVGAPNGDYCNVYRWNGGNGDWSQLGQTMDGLVPRDLFGVAVGLSLSGDTVVIGAASSDANGTNSGHVVVYRLTKSQVWVRVGQDIVGQAEGDRFGTSVSIASSLSSSTNSNTTRIAIGGINHDGSGTDAGHVRVFELNP